MMFKLYCRLLVFLLVLPVADTARAVAVTSLRVEEDFSVTLLLHRLSTGQLIEWPTRLKAQSPLLSHDHTGLPVSDVHVDDDGRFVVFESSERLSTFEAGSPPFVYVVDFTRVTPTKRFLGQGSDPRISGDGRRIAFDRIVDGITATVSLDTRDWALEVLDGRQTPRDTFGRAWGSRLPHTEWMVPLLPFEDSIRRERLILINRNPEETVVTARLQRGHLTWKRSFTVPARGAVSVDPCVELRRGTEETLVGLSAPLPILAEYRLEEAPAAGGGSFGVPALDPGTASPRLVFSFPEKRTPWRGTLALANIDERATKVRIVVVDSQGQEDPGSVHVVSVMPRAVALVDLSPLPAGQVRVEALDRGQVAGTLIVRGGS